ncbi:BAG family molecular chaperone regulator 5, mitochondrial-like [Impatiens glandulifera]|uniref:BAG family molecular chaperone regulator 5, mitochondrial-like n=1 Tax=Impatiens glandulifera TaxID=253017 RepID=UPI001FB183A3|nr:BAG family molecular chaperone regulator 5, mitochondrial-like [Impatiens glandulifera]
MAMRNSRRPRFSSSSSTTYTTTFYEGHDYAPPQSNSKTTEIPISHTLPASQEPSAAATKIQASYRSHVVRSLVRKISAINSEANRLETLIQLQETVDAIRFDSRERIKMNEALMKLLLTLDSIPGADPSVKEFRRRTSRRIVGLQEILDAVSDTKMSDWDGLMGNWYDALAEIEGEVCRERGGHEMEKFCAENLGFQCFQRFLSE